MAYRKLFAIGSCYLKLYCRILAKNVIHRWDTVAGKMRDAHFLTAYRFRSVRTHPSIHPSFFIYFSFQKCSRPRSAARTGPCQSLTGPRPILIVTAPSAMVIYGAAGTVSPDSLVPRWWSRACQKTAVVRVFLAGWKEHTHR